MENKRTRWEYPFQEGRDDLQGAVWERKLELLKQLTPRPVDPAALARKLVDGRLKEPSKWQWRETDNERRRRLRYIKDADKAKKEDEKRRREAPTEAEQVEDCVEFLVREVEERSLRRQRKAEHKVRRLAPHSRSGSELMDGNDPQPPMF